MILLIVALIIIACIILAFIFRRHWPKFAAVVGGIILATALTFFSGGGGPFPIPGTEYESLTFGGSAAVSVPAGETTYQYYSASFGGSTAISSPSAPVVETNASTNTNTTASTLNGYLRSASGETNCSTWFEWGKTTSYGNTTYATGFDLLDTEANLGVRASWGDGTYIYTADYSGGISAYTFNGQTFTEVASRDDGGYYYDVWGDGTYLYVACSDAGIRTYSFNDNATNEFWYRDHDDEGSAYVSVWGDGTYIYAACMSEGLRVYSQSGGELTWEDTHYHNGEYYDVWGDTANSRLYIAADNVGVLLYDTFDGETLDYITSRDDGFVYNVWVDSNGYIYANEYTSEIIVYSYTGGVGFSLLDSSDVADNSADNSQIWGDGTYVYLTHWTAGMYAYKFDGSTLVVEDTQDDGGFYRALWGDGTYIYAGASNNGLFAYGFELYSADTEFSRNLTGLDPDTTYHFRAVASNKYDTGYGSDAQFTTSGITYEYTSRTFGGGATVNEGATYNSWSDWWVMYNAEQTATYETSVQTTGVDYFTWLGSNVSAYHVIQNISATWSSGEYVAIYNNDTYDSTNALWNISYGTDPDSNNWTVHTFDIVKTYITDDSGDITVTMTANPEIAYSNAREVTCVATNNGYNYVSYGPGSSDLETISETNLNQATGYWTGYWDDGWSFWISNISPSAFNEDVPQWGVLQIKVGQTRYLNCE